LKSSRSLFQIIGGHSVIAVKTGQIIVAAYHHGHTQAPAFVILRTAGRLRLKKLARDAGSHYRRLSRK
jgi:hypothetical protein